MSNFVKPEYPTILTAENWNRKKGVIAKMAGETGIGASLTKLKKVFDDTDWKVIQVDDRKPNPSDFRLDAWEKMCKEAATQAVSEVGKVRIAAYETRDLAKKVAEKFAKSPVIPKDITKLCNEISTAADHLGVACNPNSVGGYIAEVYKSGRMWVDATAKMVIDGTLKNCIANAQKSLKSLKAPEDWKGNDMKSKARAVTQIVGNAVKVVNAGYPLNVSTAECKKIFDGLTLYANNTEQPFKDGDVSEFEKHRKVLGEWLEKADKL